jgi:hypothetical protein
VKVKQGQTRRGKARHGTEGQDTVLVRATEGGLDPQRLLGHMLDVVHLCVNVCAVVVLHDNVNAVTE